MNIMTEQSLENAVGDKMNAKSNEVKWEYDAGGGFTAAPAVVDGRIILGNTDGTLYCFGSKKNIKK